MAGALSWDVVEGRREGEIRAGLAERVRRLRRKHGEQSTAADPGDLQAALEASRQRTGVQESGVTGGDVVVGRHTWKEYIRGLHEGWLGPLEAPLSSASPSASSSSTPYTPSSAESPPDATSTEADVIVTSKPELITTPVAEPLNNATSDEASSTSQETATEVNSEEKIPEPAKPLVTPPYNTTTSYAESRLPSSTPSELGPSAPIAFPHVLGFLKTPIRMYRFLNRRHLADDIGRQTTAAVLAAHRPFNEPSASASMDVDESKNVWEQTQLLKEGEAEWNKASRDRSKDQEGQERVWLDEMVLDQRIAERMRLFEVTQEDEDRARRIAQGGVGIPGHVEETKSDYGED